MDGKPIKWYDATVSSLPDLKGKVIAITGTTTGTGNIAARVCGQKGATVLLLNRTSERSESSLKALQEAAPNATYVQIPCDLQDLSSVRLAAAEIKRLHGETGIDVLSCNAGIMAMPDEATKDGFDTQMQTNHLSHWLLASELFPVLAVGGARTGDARLVFHSSGVRNMIKKLDPKNLGKNGGNLGGNGTGMTGPRWARYNQTKLANIVCTYALADRVDAANVTAVKILCAEPGLATTNLQKTTHAQGGMGKGTIGCLFSMMGQSAEDGALPLLSAMTATDAKNGDFYLPKGGSSGPPVKIKKREKHCDDATNKKILVEKSIESLGVDIVVA